MATAARQQRALQRAQVRATRRTSVLGPILLVGVGLLLLPIESGHLAWNAALVWLARWWPLVLVVAGLILVAEWYADTHLAEETAPHLPRRSVGALGSLMLVLLLLAGVAATVVYRGSDWLQKNWGLVDSWGLDQILAQHSETVLNLDAPLRQGGLLTIQNYRGNITVTGASQDGQVHVTAHQRLWAWQMRDLQARQTHDQPTLTRNNAGLLLAVAGEGRDETDLTVEVPHESGLQVGAEKGELTISELHGPVTVAEHNGNIILTALTGDVHLMTRDDNANVSGHSLSGTVALDGRSGDLALSDVTGPVTLHGDFFGTTHLERVSGPVHFQSSFTTFSCAGVPGELNVEGRSELEADNITGPVVLSTTDRELTLSNVRKGLSVTNRKGSVTLSLLDPLGPVDVSTTDGSIEMRVPERSAFQVAADTANGELNQNLGLHAEQHGDRVTLAGQVGTGGPRIQLRTTDGDITLHRGDDSTADDKSTTNSKSDDDDDDSNNRRT